MFKIVNENIMTLAENENKVQRTPNRELKKKDANNLFLIHICIDLDIYDMIIEE